MLISHDREKMVNAIVYFLNNTKYCGITKLCKLMYYLDFLHFRETGRPVTGMDYYAWDFGPVPQKLYDEINKDELMPDLKESISILPKNEQHFVVMKARKKFSSKYFTNRELRILKQVAFIFKDARTGDIVEASHLPKHPWDETKGRKGLNAKIDYMLALDSTSESISTEEALERIADREEIKKAFVG